MSDNDEEARAQLWRDEQVAKLLYARAHEIAMAGNADRAAAVRAAWDALRTVNDDGVPRVGFEDYA